MKIQPQPGPQTDFLSTAADIGIYGGAAGGGKSWSLLVEPLRHVENKKFGGTIFRRTTVQIRNEGGLWDESLNIYMPLHAHPREHRLEWQFPSGMRMSFGHLEYEKTVYDWQGAQLPFMGFDELTHFTETQFWYMLSRNRSTSGVAGYVRATCNPDSDSWVREFIDWWIGPDGYPIKERGGKLRWFIRRDGLIHWGDSREELLEKFGRDELPKSVTFIPSLVHDNKILIKKDPAYLANLKALSRVDRLRLLGGNWDVRAAVGMYFQKEWFPIIDAIPAGWKRRVRYWDRAATKPNENNKDPDYTVGLLLYGYPNGTFVVGDIRRMRDTPLAVERYIRNTADFDGHSVEVIGEQDPGSAGVADAQAFIRLLSGYVVRIRKISKDKATRAKPVSAQSEAGNIRVLRAPWNDAFFQELENFTGEEGKGHDDQVDTLSGAFNEFAQTPSILDVS